MAVLFVIRKRNKNINMYKYVGKDEMKIKKIVIKKNSNRHVSLRLWHDLKQ